MKTALIDADSIVYILAYVNREHEDVSTIKEACDNFLKSILTLTGCTHYVGVFSSDKNFRHREYLQAQYKGQRKEKASYQTRWEPVIKEHFTATWKFITPEDLEADDIVVCAASFLKGELVICSPDKDLWQIAGNFYDYKKNEHKVISEHEANFNLWMQVLTGDTTDNIKGVPGIGSVGANKLLSASNPVTWKSVALSQYVKYFGDYYGEVIFKENLNAVQMMCPTHSKFPLYWEHIKSIVIPVEFQDKSSYDIRANLFQL